MPMSLVKYISSAADIPDGQNYVLVEFGIESEQKKHPLGFTITVPRNPSKTVSELSFLAHVHSAKQLAKREGIRTIYARK
jgi:hypothetical protein